MIGAEVRACEVEAPPWAHSFRLISLGEIMDALDPTDLFTLFNSASLFKQIGLRLDQTELDKGMRRTMKDGLLKDKATCERWALPYTVMHLDRMISMLDRQEHMTYEEIGKDGGDQFTQRLGDELSLILFLRLLPDRARFYNRPFEGWDAAIGKFPSIRFDVEEASKSFALDRYTATVLHCMRVLEIGLTTFGDHYKVDTGRGNWHEILVAIERVVAALNPPGENWQQERQFGSEACLQFRFFKDAWRNHVMHVRETFDDQRAKLIYQHVREFMEHLATRLKERK